MASEDIEDEDVTDVDITDVDITNEDFMNEIVTCSSRTNASVDSLFFQLNSKLYALAFM